MFTRMIVMAGGFAGAAGLSQFPEYSQQYLQRMSGKAEELSRFVEEFDADARDVGISREQALIDLAQSGAIGAARAQTMVTTIQRHEDMSAALEALKSAGPYTRVVHANVFTDSDLARGTLEDFEPAVPLTFDGLAFAAIGFLAGFGVLAVLIGLLRLPFRKRRAA
jgi:hypothetical protein